MKEIIELLATKISLKCPYCYELLDGFYEKDPRNKECKCEYCGETFTINPEAVIEMY